MRVWFIRSSICHFLEDGSDQSAIPNDFGDIEWGRRFMNGHAVQFHRV